MIIPSAPEMRWRLERKIYRAVESLYVPHYFNIGNFRDLRTISILPELGLVYNAVRKSGSTTVRVFLSELGGSSFRTAEQAKVLGQRNKFLWPNEVREMESYFSFTVVRDPYARLLSAFRHRVSIERDRPGILTRNIQNFAGDSGYGFDQFLDFLGSGGISQEPHWRPQCESLYKPADRFDFVGKLERIDADMRLVLEAVSLPVEFAEKLPQAGRLARHETRAVELLSVYYSRERRARVRDLYYCDFEAFGYNE